MTNQYDPYLFKKSITSVLESIRRMHIADYNEAAQMAKVAQAATELEGQICGNAVQDTFLSLYNSHPELREQVEAKLTPLKTMLQSGMQTPDWQQLKDYTTGDLVSSGIASVALARRMYDAMPDDAKEAAQKQCGWQSQADEAQETADDLAEAIESLQEQLDQMIDEADKLPDQVAPLDGDLEAKQQEAQQQAIDQMKSRIDGLEAAQEAQAKDAQAFASQAQQNQQAFDNAIQSQAAQVAHAMNNAAKETYQETQETMAFVKSFTLAAGGNPEQVSPEALAQAMRAIQTKPALSELTDMLGWAKEAVLAAWRESDKGTQYPIGYKPDSLEISRIHSSELMNMTGAAGEARQLDFYRRAADGEILHRDSEGETPQNRGDIMIVRDESGSMTPQDHNFALGIEWAISEVIKRDKKRFLTSYPFSGQDQWHEFEYPRNRPNFEALADHLSQRYSGGTEPYGPLEAAIDKIISEGAPADVLVITDAVIPAPSARIMQKLDEARAMTKVKIIAVVIGVPTKEIRQWADLVLPVTSLWDGREQFRVALGKIM